MPCLARLALLMLGDRDAARDVVQDAFFGLYRRWDKLTSPDAARTRADAGHPGPTPGAAAGRRRDR